MENADTQEHTTTLKKRADKKLLVYAFLLAVLCVSAWWVYTSMQPQELPRTLDQQETIMLDEVEE